MNGLAQVLFGPPCASAEAGAAEEGNFVVCGAGDHPVSLAYPPSSTFSFGSRAVKRLPSDARFRRRSLPPPWALVFVFVAGSAHLLGGWLTGFLMPFDFQEPSIAPNMEARRRMTFLVPRGRGSEVRNDTPPCNTNGGGASLRRRIAGDDTDIALVVTGTSMS